MLKAISRSTFDLRTGLDTLLQSAVKLRSADQGTVAQRKGDTFYRSVSYGFSPVYLGYVKDIPVEPGRDTGTGRALLDGKAHSQNPTPRGVHRMRTKRGRLGRRARSALARLAVCRSVTVVGLSSNGRMISGEGAASQIAEQVCIVVTGRGAGVR